MIYFALGAKIYFVLYNSINSRLIAYLPVKLNTETFDILFDALGKRAEVFNQFFFLFIKFRNGEKIIFKYHFSVCVSEFRYPHKLRGCAFVIPKQRTDRLSSFPTSGSNKIRMSELSYGKLSNGHK